MIVISDSIPMLHSIEGNFHIKKIDAQAIRELARYGCVNTIKNEALKRVIKSAMSMEVGPTVDVWPRLGEDTVILVGVIGKLPEDAVVLPMDSTLSFSILKAGASVELDKAVGSAVSGVKKFFGRA
jgi:hypothetical protein